MALLLAEVAEQAGRFDDMMLEMRRFCSERSRLNLKERNLLAAACKSCLASRLFAVRTLKSQALEENSLKRDCLSGYLHKLQVEIQDICDGTLEILAKLKAGNSEDIVFYKKMQADYYRVKAEFNQPEAAAKSHWNYSQAEILAERDLPVWNPIRLSVALNFCILIAQEDEKRARQKARQAYDAALDQLDAIPEDVYKDSTLILQLLRDVVEPWRLWQEA